MIYVIYDMANISQVDFSQVHQTSEATLRLSVDEKETVLKFTGNTPSIFSRFATIYSFRNISNNEYF